MNYHLSNIISELLEPIADQSPDSVEVLPSEDMLSSIDKLNKELEQTIALGGKEREKIRDLILIGADAEVLYPSLTKEILAKVIREQVEKLPINFQDLDWKEMGKKYSITF